MLLRCFSFSLFGCIASFAAAQPMRALDSLGEVHFPTSCEPTTLRQFDLGMALLHSFEFREAEAAFRNVEKEDPKCVIAAWGIAAFDN